MRFQKIPNQALAENFTVEKCLVKPSTVEHGRKITQNFLGEHKAQCSRMAMQIRKFKKGTFLNFEKKFGLGCW